MKIKIKKRTHTSSSSTVQAPRGIQRLPDGTYASGKEKTGGREKGTLNKFTTLKHSFLNVFKDLGGDEALLKFAKIEQKDFYRWIASMLPREVNIGSTEEVQPNNLGSMSDEELDAIIEERERIASRSKSGESE